MTSEFVTVLSHSMGWLCGQLFGDAVLAAVTGATWWKDSGTFVHRLFWAALGTVAFVLSIVLIQVRLSGAVEDRCEEFEEEESDVEDTLVSARE